MKLHALVCGVAVASGCVSAGLEPTVTEDVVQEPVILEDELSTLVDDLLDDGYRWVPGGWLYHPDCILVVPDGSRVEDHRVVLRDGGEVKIPSCKQPRYRLAHAQLADPLSSTLARPEPVPGTTNGYVESRSYTNTTGHLTKLNANWYVPAEPTLQGNQTIFLFPGLQGTQVNGYNCILQPVLQWGNGHTSWKYASWCYGLPGATVVSSTLLNASPGQAMSGTVSAANCNSSWSKCDWTVRTCAGGQCTSLTRTDLDPVDYAFAGALEVYGVTSCSQYPATGSTTFSNLKLYRNDVLISPSYAGSISSGLSPYCQFATSQPSSTSVKLSY